MNEKHLLFLDYLLPILSKCPDGEFIDSIAYEYEKEFNIIFDMNEIAHFESLYEYKYFTFPYSDLNRTAIITPETKEIIDHYGSLSKYLNIIAESKSKEQEKLDNKEKLETEVLKLQKENLEYITSIRDKEEIIRNLEIRLKRIELIKQYRWFIGFILTSCTILGVLLDRLLQLLWP